MPRHATKTSFKPGKLHPKWKGGTYDYCHREARKITGCPKGLIVHHKDKDITNNNLKNVQIMTQSEHVALHNKERTGSINRKSPQHILKKEIQELTSRGISSREIANRLCIGKSTVLRSRNKYGGIKI